LGKKHLLHVGFVIFICCFLVAVYIFTSGTMSGPGGPERHWETTRVTNLEFIDGGHGNDTVVATVINTADKALSITNGYVIQSYWFDNGFVYRSHEKTAELFGDLSVPANCTRDIHLSLPKDTLIAGKTYAVELNTTQQQPPLMKYIDSQNSFHTISAPKTYTFYHMNHPHTSGSVEEGVITWLAAGYCDSNYADSISATVQNTGDFPLTIVGGFVNGRAAINATDSSIHSTGIEQCVIEKNATGSVTLNFPAGSLYYNRQNPFNVKLVTAEGNVIECADMFYPFDFSVSDRIQQPTVVREQAVITSVKFSYKDGKDDSMAVTIHNSGSNPIDILSGLLNGKATTILSSNAIVDAGSTQTFTFQVGTLVQGSEYQVVLISSQNNGFINSSKYSPFE
jgi:hypothetical protein